MGYLFSIIGLFCLSVLRHANAQGLEEVQAFFKLFQLSFIEKASELTSGPNPKVKTSSGILHGTRNNNAQSFFDIPFAVPPIGDKRYQPPQMLNQPDVVQHLPAEGSISCPAPLVTSTEDCLILNVHVPLHVRLTDAETPPSERLPVLFFIHGGAYMFGSSDTKAYDGRFLSETANAVVVTTNYRLGPLGFLVFDDGKNVIEGNQGLKDQQLAMEWVQNNIEGFGGNKSKVTIFGESAGGQSVLFHLVSSKSEPTFQQAQIESNPAIYNYPTREEALKVTEKLVDTLRCDAAFSTDDCCPSDKDSYTCLMEASTKSLLDGMQSMALGYMMELKPMEAVEPFRPYIDGKEFKDQPLALLRDGSWNKYKSFIVGVNKEELDPFGEFFVLSRQLYRVLNLLVFRTNGLKIANKYEETYPEQKNYSMLFAREVTDLIFGCPSRSLARLASATTEASIYFYIYDHPIESENCTEYFSFLCKYSFHSVELPFVFRTLEYTGMTPSDNDVSVTNQWSTYMKSFAWTGSPDGDANSDFPDWVPYSAKTNYTSIRITGPKPNLEMNAIQEVCDVWDSTGYYPTLFDNRK